MAIQIKWRNATASSWTSTNPVLSQGEKGVETDTGQFKVGDGVTAWTSLGYLGQTGPTQTLAYRSLGDGSDGNITISSGTTTLTRDMFYSNLTINGTGVLNTNNFKVFVSGVLDLTAAQAGAIQNNGNVGGNASGATGGSAPTAEPAGTLNANGQGGAGATATTAAGTAGTAGTALTGGGGSSNGAGAGGTGTNAGGAGAGGITPTVAIISRWETNFLRGVTLLAGGAGAGGGGAGGGDGTNTGGGGGAGGNGGGFLAIYANVILTSSSTPAGVIQSMGGMGGNGGSGTAGVTGGGGGGGGGAGGYIYIAYNLRAGPQITGLIDVSAGMGGNGGNGFGTGAAGGKGGNAGNGGTVTLYQIPSATSSNIIFNNSLAATTWTAAATGSAAVGNTGGVGGFPQTARVTF